MRTADARQSSLFSTLQIEDRIPRTHPLRQVRSAACAVLGELRHRLDGIYPPDSRTVAAPEEVLRSMLLWGLYGIPSERRLMEELDYNLLYRWFVGLQLDDQLWSRAAFSAHRRRLHKADLIGEFVRLTLTRLPGRVLGNPHFTPNRPLLEAWAGQLRWDVAAGEG
jgi:transposase